MIEKGETVRIDGDENGYDGKTGEVIRDFHWGRVSVKLENGEKISFPRKVIDVSEKPEEDFEREEVVIKKEGVMEGDNGHIYDIEEWNGETIYIDHVYAPHDRTVELKENEFEKIS